jgi:hypothetical protein
LRLRKACSDPYQRLLDPEERDHTDDLHQSQRTYVKSHPGAFIVSRSQLLPEVNTVGDAASETHGGRRKDILGSVREGACVKQSKPDQRTLDKNPLHCRGNTIRKTMDGEDRHNE